MMKISILTPDISHNCLGRAYILAKALQKKFDVEIVGPVFGKGIWSPVACDDSIVYKIVNFSKGFNQLFQLRSLYKKIDGDIIYASKPLFTSFGIGLIKKFFTKKPLILDIDDWERGFNKDRYYNSKFINRLKYLKSRISKFYKKSSSWCIFFLEKLTGLADKLTVSNNFLKKKFGGTIIWHGRDENFFNPKNFPRSLLRKKYKINNSQKVIMFLGTPRKYKGVEDLIEAVSSNKNDNILLFIVGIDEKEYCKNLLKYAEKKLKGKFIAYGLQPFQKIPEFLSIADIVVIPQRQNYSTIGQTPAKVFDSMAMAKPIITTNASDLPEILDDCGLIVEPEDPKKLSKAIDYFISNPKEAANMGQKARKRFEDKYSWDKISKKLFEIVEEVKQKYI